jgi:hypothetical protein
MVGVEPALRVELPSTLRFQLPQLLLKLCNLGGSTCKRDRETSVSSLATFISLTSTSSMNLLLSPDRSDASLKRQDDGA